MQITADSVADLYISLEYPNLNIITNTYYYNDDTQTLEMSCYDEYDCSKAVIEFDYLHENIK